MKLRELIFEYLEENGEPNTKYRRAYTLAVSGLREMAYDLTSIIEVAELDITSADIAELPENYINLSRIGLCGSDGLIHSFAQNDNICLTPTYNDCGAQIQRPVNIAYENGQGGGFVQNSFVDGNFIGSTTFVAAHYRNGEAIGGWYGMGGGVDGIYRIDREKRQIQFGALPNHSEKVVLEYLADIKSVNDDFEIHPFMILAMKEWVNWRWLIPTKREGEIQGAYRRYVVAYQTMRRRFNSETPFDWMNAIRRANSATPKF